MWVKIGGVLLALIGLAGCDLVDGKPETVRVTVAAAQVTCTGITQQRCYQVRFADNEPWQLYYGEIKGFDFQPGNQYELEVRQQDATQTDLNQSRLTWELVKEIAHTPVAVSALPAAPTAHAATVPVETLPAIGTEPAVEEDLGPAED